MGKKKKKDKTCILSNRLYVPTHLVTPSIMDAFTYEIGDETFCDRCTFKNNNSCEGCPYHGDAIELFKEHKNKGYISFTRGDLGKIYKVFGHLKIDDNRANVPFRYNLKWRKKKKLYSYQKKSVRAWMEYQYGQIKAKARSGKTVMAVNLVTRLKQKTLILSHLKELLEQFENTFRDFTNINKLEKNLGHPILGYANSLKQFEDFDICLCSWQMFNSKQGKRKLKDYRDYFGMVVVDEAHRASSAIFSKVVNTFNPEIRLGLTATPERKDEMHIIHDHAIGPVVITAQVKSLRCRINWLRTGYKIPSFENWVTMVNRLTQAPDRNDLIVKTIIKDVKRGHSVIAVSCRVNHVKEMAKAINNKGITARPLFGKSPDRKEILEDARSGKLKVVIAMRQIVSVGIDCPRWSSYHCLVPMANAPNFYQEMSRIRTPLEGKLTPIINYYMDTHEAMYACKAVATKVMKAEGFL